MNFIFIFIFAFPCFAWTPPDTFNSTYIDLEDSIFAATIRGRYRDAEGYISNETADEILQDKKNIVSDKFLIPKYFNSSVKFWFSIYTQYSSDQVVIHDMDNLKLVYNVIDFSELHNNQRIHRFSKSKLQSQLALEYTRRLKKNLKHMSQTKISNFSEEEDDIYRRLKNSKIKVPKGQKQKNKFFLKLAKNIRTQTGQRNKVFKGIVRSIPYMPFLKKQIKNFNLPKELLAIPFLESSFNPIAKSKVSAAGVWQFMPHISNLFMPKIKENIDYRLNPVISSLAAMHLLKENKLILRKWDLAVTAYNSGPKHLKRAIKILSKKRKKSRIGLDYILKNYKHPHIGFASKNFYSEFLALVHVLAYKNIIYPLDGIRSSINFDDPQNLKIYVTKQKVRPQRYFKLMKKTSPNIEYLNGHFLHIGDLYSKGTIIVSDRKLNPRKYKFISDKTVRGRFPKSFRKLIK